MYCARNGSWTVVRGRLATSCCRRGRFPREIAALRVVASCGGRGSQSVLRVFLNREKPLCYSVQTCKCIPGIYVIVKVIRV